MSTALRPAHAFGQPGPVDARGPSSRPGERLARAALAVAATALTVSSAACGGGEPALRVLAASSLTDAFTAMGRDFETAHPGVAVEFGFAGSQVLRTQIEHGAPADVIASADTAQTSALHNAGLIETPVRFARNVLTIVTPESAPRVLDPGGLAAPGISVVLAEPSVPAGRYTSEALARMEASGRFGERFVARVRANVVSEEPNVRGVLAKIALGEADAGIVYRTDAASAGVKVRTIAIPEDAAPAAEYTVGICTLAPRADAARAFVEHLLGPEGRARLLEHGFGPP